MKLYSPKDMDQVAGVCCRQSPLRGAIGGLILCAFFIGAAFLSRHARAPAPVWILCAILAAVIVPLVVVDMVAKFRSTNWLLWIRPDGLWVNLRSYLNRDLPDAATVLHLAFEEIACAHRHLETWSIPNSGRAVGIEIGAAPRAAGRYRATQWKEESLELHLASGDTREIAQALANERGLKAGFTGTHQAVTVPTPGVVRIAWRGHGNDVVPGLGRVLDELSPYIKLADPTRTDRPSWQQLSEAELDELLAQLVRSGDQLAASELLMRRRGCSATEAHDLVEELDTRV
jgi:hypothetical protein